MFWVFSLLILKAIIKIVYLFIDTENDIKNLTKDLPSSNDLPHPPCQANTKILETKTNAMKHAIQAMRRNEGKTITNGSKANKYCPVEKLLVHLQERHTVKGNK